jgi:triphosphatase
MQDQPIVHKSTTLIISKRKNVEQAFKKIVISCLFQIERNAKNISLEYDVESVHQTRVGLRRLSCALGLFKGLISFPSTLRKELEWLMLALGAARDWDVFTLSTLPDAIKNLQHSTSGMQESETTNRSKFIPLAEAAFAIGKKRQRDVSMAIESRRYLFFIICCHTWIQERKWRKAMTARQIRRLKQEIKRVSRKIISEKHTCLRKRGKKIDTENPKTLHRFRIASKESRYAAEFFSAIYTSKKFKAYTLTLNKIQEELGWFNDIEIAIGLLDELAYQDKQLQKSASLIRTNLRSSLLFSAKRKDKLLHNITHIKKIP